MCRCRNNTELSPHTIPYTATTFPWASFFKGLLTVLVLGVGLAGLAAGGPIIRRSSDGEWLYDMGVAYVSATQGAPTTVLVSLSLTVKGAMFKYISGSGTIDRFRYPPGTMGDVTGTLTGCTRAIIHRVCWSLI
jgi:hypothetical protein